MKKFALIFIIAVFLAAALCIPVFAEESSNAVSEISQAEETIGGISKTAWTVVSVCFVLLVCYAAYSVKFKNKK